MRLQLLASHALLQERLADLLRAAGPMELQCHADAASLIGAWHDRPGDLALLCVCVPSEVSDVKAIRRAFPAATMVVISTLLSPCWQAYFTDIGFQGYLDVSEIDGLSEVVHALVPTCSGQGRAPP